MGAVFISYSHAAENREGGPAWKKRLLECLQVFTRHGLVDAWVDEKIGGGWRWQHEIERAIETAQVAAVLLTAETLASDFILRHELAPLSEREAAGALTVIPILCEPCDWQAHEWLRTLQIRPFEAIPLSVLTEVEYEDALRSVAVEIANELSRRALGTLRTGRHLSAASTAETQAHVDVNIERLPRTSRQAELIGREQELALLDLAAAQRRTTVLSLIAWGGVGKTVLIQHWLERLDRENWFDFSRVYAWSFHSQGTTEDQEASEELFLANALTWFGVPHDPAAPAWEKGRLLAEALENERALLILDGIEPLQYPPGPLAGSLRAPGLRELLSRMANRKRERGSLCVLMARETVADLNEFQGSQSSPERVVHLQLANLTDRAGAVLLWHSGARFAGPVEIPPEDPELRSVSREVDGHALTLTLLGRFLGRAHQGDIRRRDLVQFDKSDSSIQGGHTFRMLAAFQQWFASGGQFGARRLAILRMLGLFDRPAEAHCVIALRRLPAIAGLTSALFMQGVNGADSIQPITEEDFNETVSFLVESGLLTSTPGRSVAGKYARSLDCHPLIREYFAREASRVYPEGWQAAHERLYMELKDTTPEIAEPTLEELHPLYNALHHACAAKLFLEARALYFQRMLRSADEHYSWFRLGAFGSDLQFLSAFFESKWDRPCEEVPARMQNWLWGEVGYCLRSLGRVREACLPFEKGASSQAEAGNWLDAATVFRNLAEAELVLGSVEDALNSAIESVETAKRSGTPIPYAESLAMLAHVQHQRGMRMEAAKTFDEAAAANLPFGALVFGVSAFRSHDLLLEEPERGAACIALELPFSPDQSERETIRKNLLARLETISSLSQQSLRYADQAGFPIISAVARLSAGRVALYGSVLAERESERVSRADAAERYLAEAEPLFRASSMIEFIPALLLSRAWLKCRNGDMDGGRADLNEAWRVAARGEMLLHLADIHLFRLRLFHKAEPYPWSANGRQMEDDVEDARELIEDCEYGRRRNELADIEVAMRYLWRR